MLVAITYEGFIREYYCLKKFQINSHINLSFHPPGGTMVVMCFTQKHSRVSSHVVAKGQNNLLYGLSIESLSVFWGGGSCALCHLGMLS